MQRTLISLLIVLAVVAITFSSPLRAEPLENRIALVIGDANYSEKPLATPANDAGLIAQTLQAAGFDVAGARDLDEDSLRHAFRDFVEKARASGPDTVAFVYFAGYGLQLEGENFLVPIDAARDPDAPSRSMRVSDFLRPLSALHLKLGIVVLDAARSGPFSLSGQQLAGGLALAEPGANILLAFSAAPGTAAPEENGPYGVYAQALAEMMREGGLPLGNVFERVRLRVNDATRGAQVPWNSAGVKTSFVFFQQSAEAPPPAAPVEQTAAVRSKPIRSLGARDAYVAAVERDTLQGYEEFSDAYSNDPMAKRVRAMIAARREAIFWRRSRTIDTSNAYWTYLRRYPHGPHAWDARHRLSEIAAALEPPQSFAMIEYDVPPPPPEEIIYVERPVLVFNDPFFDFVPPPPAPIYFLPPPPPDFIVLPPPVVVVEPYVLPIPIFVPIPVWRAPPPYVAPPPNNVIFANIHNTVVVNHVTNLVEVKKPSGQIVSSEPIITPGGRASPITVSLPPSVTKKAEAVRPSRPGDIPSQGPQGAAPAAHEGVLPLLVPVPLPGTKPLPTQPQPGATRQAPAPTLGQPTAPPSAPAPHVAPPATQSKPTPSPAPASQLAPPQPMVRPQPPLQVEAPALQRQHEQQLRAREQEAEQQRQQQLRQQQIERQHEQQLIEQQREQQLLRMRQQETEQQRQQQLRQQQIEQQRQQLIEQQQREQRQLRARQQEMEQERQQQLRRQQLEQQREQQQLRTRQQEMEQQERQQQLRRQQLEQQRELHQHSGARGNMPRCGQPGLPPC